MTVKRRKNMNCFSGAPGTVTLETVSLPAATSIGYRAFHDCTSLEELSFGALTAISSDYF
jgi:hypothetical protein